MLQKVVMNKKIIIPVLALVLVLCVGIAILVTQNKEEASGKHTGNKTEQGKENADSVDDVDKTDKPDAGDKTDNQEDNKSTGLEVVEPGVVIQGNSSDASGEWGEPTDSETQSGDSTTTVVPEKTPSDEQQDNLEIDDPKDDKIWSEVY